MVAAEHKPGTRCGNGSCRTVALFAVRASGTSVWVYACGWHVARTIRERAAMSDRRAITEVLR